MATYYQNETEIEEARTVLKQHAQRQLNDSLAAYHALKGYPTKPIQDLVEDWYAPDQSDAYNTLLMIGYIEDKKYKVLPWPI